MNPVPMLSTIPSPSTRHATIDAVYAAAHWLLMRQKPVEAAKVFRLMLRMAPRDERAWLGLGECHEAVDQLRVAAELYGAGSVLAASERTVSVRCLLARSRALTKLGLVPEADSMLDAAERAAVDQQNDDLLALVARQRKSQS